MYLQRVCLLASMVVVFLFVTVSYSMWHDGNYRGIKRRLDGTAVNERINEQEKDHASDKRPCLERRPWEFIDGKNNNAGYEGGYDGDDEPMCDDPKESCEDLEMSDLDIIKNN